MNRRWNDTLGTISLVLALTTWGCGGEDKKDPETGGDSDAAAVDASPDVQQDAGAASKDTGGGSVQKDAGTTPVQKVACGPALACLLQCDAMTGACADKCKTNLADGVDAKLKAVDDCRTNQCANAGNPTKVTACAVDKCFGAVDACVAFGSGKLTCAQTAACLGACTFGDLACNVSCLIGGAKGEAAKAKGYKACFDGKCSTKPEVEMPACVTESCATEVDTCVGATKMDCSTLSACVAKCPTNNKTEPNHCDAYCRSFAEGQALQTWSKYEACKQQCLLVTNPVGCIIDKCSTEQQTCYTKVGKINCQEVYDCVVKECDGIGGDPKCIDKCREQGNASAQDAYLHWEGCVLLNLQREEAKTVKCSFPYAQATCINYISNHFCGHKSAHCFTSN